MIMKQLSVKKRIDMKMKYKTSRGRYSKKISFINTKQASQAISLCLGKDKMVREQEEGKLYRKTSFTLLSKCFSDEQEQIEEDEDDHERPISEDED